MSSPIIVGIDPGPTHSAMVSICEGKTCKEDFYGPNDEIKEVVKSALTGFAFDEMVLPECKVYVVIEQVKHYGTGMPVGASIFDTVEWYGRFIEAWSGINRWKIHIEKIPRATIKAHLCGSTRAKDSNVRQALIDRYPATGGGATPQIGIKKKPGPLYGITKHLWAALAVAVYKSEMLNNKRFC